MQKLHTLRMLLLQRYPHLWLAAQDLSIRPELLSGFLSGREQLSRGMVAKLEAALARPSADFLPQGYILKGKEQCHG